MCNDDTPMVRRAAAANIGKFAGAMEKEHIASMILPLFRALTADDQDSVRLLAIENSADIAELLSQDDNSMHVLPIVRSSVEDRSWRVRFSIAKDFFPLSRAMGAQITESELLGCFSNLLQVRRRCEICRQDGRKSRVTHELGCLPLIFFTGLGGGSARCCCEELVGLHLHYQERAVFERDPSAAVGSVAGHGPQRSQYVLLSFCSVWCVKHVLTLFHVVVTYSIAAAVSIACMELAPKLGEATSKSTLAPLLLLFLRDEVVDVRLNILKRMELLAQWMTSFESVLLPAIADLARDLQWRVREAVILSIPALAGSLGGQYFQEHLLEIYVSAFTDMVGEVRLSATKILPQLLESLGSDYILQNVMPRLNQIFEKSVIYQERVNVLHALKQMAVEKVSSDLLTLMTTLAIRGAHDKIPNVRFVASMTLEQLCKFADASVVAAQVRYVQSPSTLCASRCFHGS